jgi:hypothetical protein
MRNSGVTNPTPASASAPNPATHAASARLYMLTSSIDIINGTLILRTAVRGSPSIVFTPSVSCSVILNQLPKKIIISSIYINYF